MPGRPPAVSDYEIVRAVEGVRRATGDPAVTTSEVADRLPIKREGLGRRLNDLADRELVTRKRVGASYIWWLPDDVRAVVSPDADADRETPADRADRPVDERLQDLFEIGRERFGLELGALARVDPATDQFRIEYASDTHEGFEPGTELPLSETYCTTATDARGPAGVADPETEGVADRTVCTDVGFETYLGTLVDLDSGADRTFFFVSPSPREEPFPEEDLAFQKLLGQRVKQELQESA